MFKPWTTSKELSRTIKRYISFMKTFILVALSAFSLGFGVEAKDQDAVVFIDKQQLSELLLTYFPKRFKTIAPIDVCEAKLDNQKDLEWFKYRRANLSDLDDVYMICDNDMPLNLVIAETDNKIHSLRILVPVVNYTEQESEQVFKFMADLSEVIFPEWKGANEWPAKSLLASWERSAIVDREAYEQNPDRVFERHIEGGVTSTVFGVPPDVVLYDFSVLDRCKPTVKMGNPFARLVC